jgi:hypothetical protein
MRYFTPTSKDYQSTFVPTELPFELMLKSLDNKQNAYDNTVNKANETLSALEVPKGFNYYKTFGNVDPGQKYRDELNQTVAELDKPQASLSGISKKIIDIKRRFDTDEDVKLARADALATPILNEAVVKNRNLIGPLYNPNVGMQPINLKERGINATNIGQVYGLTPNAGILENETTKTMLSTLKDQVLDQTAIEAAGKYGKNAKIERYGDNALLVTNYGQAPIKIGIDATRWQNAIEGFAKSTFNNTADPHVMFNKLMSEQGQIGYQQWEDYANNLKEATKGMVGITHYNPGNQSSNLITDPNKTGGAGQYDDLFSPGVAVPLTTTSIESESKAVTPENNQWFRNDNVTNENGHLVLGKPFSKQMYSMSGDKNIKGGTPFDAINKAYNKFDPLTNWNDNEKRLIRSYINSKGKKYYTKEEKDQLFNIMNGNVENSKYPNYDANIKLLNRITDDVNNSGYIEKYNGLQRPGGLSLSTDYHTPLNQMDMKMIFRNDYTESSPLKLSAIKNRFPNVAAYEIKTGKRMLVNEIPEDDNNKDATFTKLTYNSALPIEAGTEFNNGYVINNNGNSYIIKDAVQWDGSEYGRFKSAIKNQDHQLANIYQMSLAGDEEAEENLNGGKVSYSLNETKDGKKMWGYRLTLPNGKKDPYIYNYSDISKFPQLMKQK